MRAKIDANWKACGYTHSSPPTITTEEGSLYIRVVKNEVGSRSVHCFIRKLDGAIIKAAGWKAPERRPSSVRGYMTDDDFRNKITHHGVIYLK